MLAWGPADAKEHRATDVASLLGKTKEAQPWAWKARSSCQQCSLRIRGLSSADVLPRCVHLQPVVVLSGLVCQEAEGIEGRQASHVTGGDTSRIFVAVYGIGCCCVRNVGQPLTYGVIADS